MVVGGGAWATQSSVERIGCELKGEHSGLVEPIGEHQEVLTMGKVNM